MTPAELRILDKARRGHVVTVADTVATIMSLAELDAYRKGLSARGALTTDAMQAIRDRQNALHKMGAK